MALLAGCAGTATVRHEPVGVVRATPPSPPAQVGVVTQPLPERSGERLVVPAMPAAVVALLDEVETAQQAGQWEEAAATLERALRVQPNNAWLWQRYAELRLQQDKPQLALDLALKSKLLAGSDRALLQRNWTLIAAAKRRLGDVAGAEAAEKQAGGLP